MGRPLTKHWKSTGWIKKIFCWCNFIFSKYFYDFPNSSRNLILISLRSTYFTVLNFLFNPKFSKWFTQLNINRNFHSRLPVYGCQFNIYQRVVCGASHQSTQPRFELDNSYILRCTWLGYCIFCLHVYSIWQGYKFVFLQAYNNIYFHTMLL